MLPCISPARLEAPWRQSLCPGLILHSPSRPSKCIINTQQRRAIVISIIPSHCWMNEQNKTTLRMRLLRGGSPMHVYCILLIWWNGLSTNYRTRGRALWILVPAVWKLAVFLGRGWWACGVLTADMVGTGLSGRWGKNPECRQAQCWRANPNLNRKINVGVDATQRHVGVGALGQLCGQSTGHVSGWGAGIMAFGIREGSRGWVMGYHVYPAKKLWF